MQRSFTYNLKSSHKVLFGSFFRTEIMVETRFLIVPPPPVIPSSFRHTHNQMIKSSSPCSIAYK